MKNQLLTLFVLLFFSPGIFSQSWSQVGSGVTSENINDVCFVDNQIAFAVGNAGVILKSSDAGATWSTISHSLTTQPLNAIHFPTNTTGYIAGKGGIILKTTDAGNTWTNISKSNITGELLGMTFLDANTGFIVGDPGLILYTSDGGNTFTDKNGVSSDGFLRSLDFVNTTTAFVVGNEGKIKRSTDGGMTWSDFTPSTEEPNPNPDAYVGLPNTPFGVNLSGAEFGGHYLGAGQPYPGIRGTHYDYPVPSQLDYFKGKGLNLIRFPFRWERIQRELNGPLYAEEIQLMKNLVQGANDRGMKIFIDMHNFGRRGRSEYDLDLIDGSGSPVTRYHLADVWKKLATEFKDYNMFGYDIMNEPHDMASSSSWFTIAQEVINAIREVDMNTPIIICGDSWASADRWQSASDNLKNLNDPADKLIYQAHEYFDNNASGAYSGNYNAEGANPQTGVTRLTPFVNWLKTNKLKGIVGEYGIPVDATIEQWKVVLENMLKYLQENAIPGTYWSTGTRWGGNALSADPSDNGGNDRPQMEVLQKYTLTNAVE